MHFGKKKCMDFIRNRGKKSNQTENILKQKYLSKQIIKDIKIYKEMLSKSNILN